MANIHFLRKLASDELQDTLYFATGNLPVKERNEDFVILKSLPFEVKIINIRNILVNGDKCRSIPEAKYVIQQYL